MTNIQTAIGYAQLEESDKILQAKRNIADEYIKHFKNTPISWHKECEDVEHSYWMFSVTMDITEQQRNEIRDVLLKEKKIETRPLFYPIHTMPMYSQKYEMHKVSETLHRTGFNLPSFPDLTKQQIKYIAKSLLETYHEI